MTEALDHYLDQRDEDFERWEEDMNDELDALIAEKVMGWIRASDIGIDGIIDSDTWFLSIGNGKWKQVGRTGFCPSTRIADAWLVVEKMQESGYCVKLFFDMVAWSVSFMHIDGDEKHYADWKNSIETQICLAALKAVENK